jgi:3,4-dihydroxy-2-butanone 4-phosphate synthase
MTLKNQDTLKTAYTISVDATGTTTGISARDRSFTLNRLASIEAVATSFSKPGHVFPLRAVSGGVLERVGHTEASIDMCKLAGKEHVACISELVLDDGRMMRRDDCLAFGRKWGISVVTISDLVSHRMGLNKLPLSS